MMNLHFMVLLEIIKGRGGEISECKYEWDDNRYD